MQSTGPFSEVNTETASKRGGSFSSPLSPLLGMVVACIILGLAWTRIISGSIPVMAAASENGMVNGNLAAASPAKAISPLFTPEVQHWAERIAAWAENTGLDANLVATVMQIESCGDPQALSRSGAMGLFQVMPYHFAEGENPYDPDVNALRGLDYLARSLAAAQNAPGLALAGYNGGIGVIPLPESQWAAETRRYMYWGSGIYTDAKNGVVEGGRLQEWYQTSGEYLCRQAHARLGITP
jgi:soluble lytic murein transglycosylase-like protein